MGDLLFFVYTSTPHCHLQNNFQNGKKTMWIKQKREPCFTTPFHSLSLQNLIQLYIHDSTQRLQPVHRSIDAHWRLESKADHVF